jgi:hypothetical protein
MAQETPDDATPSEDVVVSTGNTQLEALETRLLGEISEEVPSGSYEAGELSGGLWLIPVFVFMIAVILWSKLRKKSPINPGEIRVVSRTPMGKEGSFAIIHVGGEEGSNQKMLVGLSEQGAPRLLSVLTADWREQDVASASADFDQFLNTMSKEEKVVEDTTHLEDRNDLVEELLNARGVDQQQMHTDGAFDGDEPLDEDDPWVVNFRRKYQSQT